MSSRAQTLYLKYDLDILYRNNYSIEDIDQTVNFYFSNFEIIISKIKKNSSGGSTLYMLVYGFTRINVTKEYFSLVFKREEIEIKISPRVFRFVNCEKFYFNIINYINK